MPLVTSLDDAVGRPMKEAVAKVTPRDDGLSLYPMVHVLGKGAYGAVFTPPILDESMRAKVDAEEYRRKPLVGKLFFQKSAGKAGRAGQREILMTRLASNYDRDHKFVGSVELDQNDTLRRFMPKNEMLDNRLKSDRSGMALEMLQENSGSRIEDLVKSMGKDNTKDGDRLVTKALEGLELLHSKEFYHCDLHLGNIMYRKETKSLMFIDFGLACLKGEFATRNVVSRLRQTTGPFTPDGMYAPEVQYAKFLGITTHSMEETQKDNLNQSIDESEFWHSFIKNQLRDFKTMIKTKFNMSESQLMGFDDFLWDTLISMKSSMDRGGRKFTERNENNLEILANAMGLDAGKADCFMFANTIIQSKLPVSESVKSVLTEMMSAVPARRPSAGEALKRMKSRMTENGNGGRRAVGREGMALDGANEEEKT